MPEAPVFRRHTIYEGGPAERMDCVVGDLDGDGVQEFVIATRNPDGLHWFGRTDEGTWVPHLMDDAFRATVSAPPWSTSPGMGSST